jgi:hypothetical protein
MHGVWIVAALVDYAANCWVTVSGTFSVSMTGNAKTTYKQTLASCHVATISVEAAQTR